MSFEGYIGEVLTIEQRQEIQDERDEAIAARVPGRFDSMPPICDDCGRLEEPGETFPPDDWEGDVLCIGCIEARMREVE